MVVAGEIQGMSTIGPSRLCNLHKLTSRCQSKVSKGCCPGGVKNLADEENQQKSYRGQCVGRRPLKNIRV